ncbi:MAG: hypothetical protein GEU80_11220 [Dehalococcoidia bacterium]|nr:hypothetical protein [Dehalococcoidia bacterium]
MHRTTLMARRGASALRVALLLLAAFAVACGGGEPDPPPAATATATDSDGTASLPTYDASNPPTSTPSTPVAAGSGTPLEGSSGSGSTGSGSGGTAVDFSALPQELRQAVTQTREIDTVEFEMTVAMTGIPELPDGAVLSADGAMDAGAGRMRMRMDLSAILDAAMQAAGGSGEADEVSAELMEALIGDGVIEMVVADGITYIRWPLIAAFAGVDTEWVGIELPPGQDPLGAGGLGGLGGAGFTDPAAVLDSLGGAGSLELVGTEEVRGVSATRYDGEIDTQAALAALSPEEQAEMEAQLGSNLQQFPTMPISLWVGEDDGLIRRVQIEVDFGGLVPAGAAGFAGAPTSTTMTMEYFGFGDDVDIEPPPAGQVTILDEDSPFGPDGDFGGTY